MLQKYMPLIFGFIYLNVAAILNVYFIISSGIRILTQEILFRKGLVAGPPAAATAGAGGGGRRARRWTGPNGRCPRRVRQGADPPRREERKKPGLERPRPEARPRPERPRPERPRPERPRPPGPSKPTERERLAGPMDHDGPPRDRKARPGARRGPPPRPPGRPTDRTAGRARPVGKTARQPAETAPRARPTDRTAPGMRPQTTKVRTSRRSTRAPRRSARERHDKQWIGWKRAVNHSPRQKRSSSISWGWLRTTPSSWFSANPRPVCSVACEGRPGSKPGCGQLPHHPSAAAGKSRPDGGTAATVLAMEAAPGRAVVGRPATIGPRVLAVGLRIGPQGATDRIPVVTERIRVARADPAGGDGEAAEAAAGDRMPSRHEVVDRTANYRTSSKSEVLDASPERVRARWKSH